MIQLNTLEDRSVHDKQHWDGAIKFLSENVTEKLEGNENTLREMVGPGWYERWTRWKNRSAEQQARAAAKGELERMLSSENDHGPHLSYEEMTTVRRNLATAGVEADNELVRFNIKMRQCRAASGSILPTTSSTTFKISLRLLYIEIY